MDYVQFTAPCGKDYFNCPLYIGEENKENRNAFLERNNLSKELSRSKECRNNKGYCPGLDVLGIDGHCKMYQCIQYKKVEYCFICNEFQYTRLQLVSDRAERLPRALNIFNLCMIQKLGIDERAIEHSKQIFIGFYRWKLDSCM